MPYKSEEKRKEAIRKSKEKYREKYRAKSLEYYYKHRGPLNPKVVRTEEELKRMVAACGKRYRKKHKEIVKKKKAEYYQRNKDKIHKKYYEKLRSNDQVRIAHCLRGRVGKAAKSARTNKWGSAVKELGCSIEEFKIFISKKFTDGMSWDNYGKWHLDHITPLCKFDLSNENDFKSAAHFTNYQPLWAIDNLTKNKY